MCSHCSSAAHCSTAIQPLTALQQFYPLHALQLAALQGGLSLALGLHLHQRQRDAKLLGQESSHLLVQVSLQSQPWDKRGQKTATCTEPGM